MSGYIIKGGGTRFKTPKEIINAPKSAKQLVSNGWRLMFKHEKQVADKKSILPGCTSPDIRMHCRYIKDSL